MIYIDKSKKYFLSNMNEDVNDVEKQVVSPISKVELMARATLDKRLNARDLKVYSYVMHFEYLCNTQEEIADILDISRSNINKSLEKLTVFRYIDKIKPKKQSERISYNLVLENAGIALVTAEDVIRLVNVSKVKEEDKFKFISKEKREALEAQLNEIEGEIKILKKIIYEVKEDKKQDLIKLLKIVDIENTLSDETGPEDAIEGLQSIKNDINKDLADTRYIENELNSFKRGYPGRMSRVMDKDLVNKVLEDENALLALFLNSSDDKKIIDFKNKYLEDYIKFLCKFTNLVENEDFFKLYYKNQIEYFVLEDLMKVANVKHREVPRIRKSFKQRVTNNLEFLLDSINEINKASDKLVIGEDLVNEIESTQDIINNINIISIEEFLICVFAMNLERDFKNAYVISYHDFLRMFASELQESLESYKKYKGEYEQNRAQNN